MKTFNLALCCLIVLFSCNKKMESRYYEFGIDYEVNRLNIWRENQNLANKEIKVFHDFNFQDQLVNSQIKFKQQVVLDVKKDYIANHYDHGTGVAVADVNNDGNYDVFFVNQVGGNELWLNKGKGTFELSPYNLNIAMKSSISVGAAFADFNNDGLTDLAVSTVRDGIFLFKNIGDGKYEDVSKLIRPNYNRHSSGLFFLDYNLDGKLDLFVTNTGVYTSSEKRSDGICFPGIPNSFDGHLYPERIEPSVLYENLGEQGFLDVSLQHNIFEPNWNGDGTFVAFGNDLRPKIYLTNMQGRDSFWVSDDKFNFTNKIQSFFPKSSWGTMGVGFFDYNNDGSFDLYTTDMHSDMFPPYPKSIEEQKRTLNNPFTVDQSLQKIIVDKTKTNFGNIFYENNGKNSFKELVVEKNLENYWPWGVSYEDLNADGFVDLFVTGGMNYTTDYGINWVYLNERADRFVNAEFTLGVEPRRELITNWFDLDCDDLDKKHSICLNRKGIVHVMAPKGSRSSVIFDLDNDGDLDIITNDFNDMPQILISSLDKKTKFNFLKVSLVGVKSNKSGLGAKIEVVYNKKKQSRFINGKSGYLSQSTLPSYFGLADSTRVDSIKVIWPSGSVDFITKDILINSSLKIEEGRGIIK